MLEDIRYGVLQLFRQRGSSCAAVLTLALGIGVSTAIISVIDAAMLRPLPYPQPEQLVTIWPEVVQPDGKVVSRASASMADMRAWQAADDTVSAVAGWGSASRGRIVDGPEPERIEVAHFTEDYLTMHGVTPIIGRGFVRADPGSPLVALLGYGYWQSHYGGRREVVGEAVRFDTETATIVGVLPAWFSATTPVSTPLRVPANQFQRRGTGRVLVYARLRQGVSLEQAGARLSARTAGGGPLEPGAGRAVVNSRLDELVNRSRTTVIVLGCAVGLVLLIACVNVAGLLLARGAARQAELAVRASLGAGRARLIRQLLIESIVMAVPAAAIGVLLAWASLDVLVANIPLAMPADAPVALNPEVLALTLAVLVPATLLFGLVPAVRLSRTSARSVLARSSRQVGSSLSRRGGQALIAAEVAVAVILVAGAGLMIRSFLRIAAVDLGFNPDGLVTLQVMPIDRSPSAHQEYYSALLRQIRGIPGISSAGLVDNFALGSGTRYTDVSVAGASAFTTVFETMPGYFETIGATLRTGRFPTDADYSTGLRGVVINESAARAMFGDAPAVGRELERDDKTWTVLGVIKDLRHRGPLDRRSLGERQVFFPYAPTPSDLNTPMVIVIRPSADLPGLADQLRRLAASSGPRALVEGIRPAHEWFGDRVITPRRRMVLLSLLGGLGLALALVGVFGMTAYAVTRRTPEIGVRLAFGARPGQVVGTMVRDAAVPIAAGTVIGVGAAALAARGIESFLFETAPADPATLAAVAVTLSAAGCLAALVPARRAARVDPASSLRAE